MGADRILILGGTGEARALAQALITEGFGVVTSLAGVTAAPVLPLGGIRRGGFGGEAGLAEYALREGFAAIVDATHPYAAQISRHAVGAARGMGIPCLRLERPAWVADPSDTWTHVASIAEAVSALPSAARALVTIGRKDIGAFFARPDIAGVARMIEAPREAVPPHWTLLLARPPFTIGDECGLIEMHGITHIVAKNSGGGDTRAKLMAARQKKLPVVMMARPKGPAEESYPTVDALILAIRGILSP
jgi:precorrin-6A/cobalt-precorrin-6A reductase